MLSHLELIMDKYRKLHLVIRRTLSYTDDFDSQPSETFLVGVFLDSVLADNILRESEKKWSNDNIEMLTVDIDRMLEEQIQL